MSSNTPFSFKYFLMEPPMIFRGLSTIGLLDYPPSNLLFLLGLLMVFLTCPNHLKRNLTIFLSKFNLTKKIILQGPNVNTITKSHSKMLVTVMATRSPKLIYLVYTLPKEEKYIFRNNYCKNIGSLHNFVQTKCIEMRT